MALKISELIEGTTYLCTLSGQSVLITTSKNEVKEYVEEHPVVKYICNGYMFNPVTGTYEYIDIINNQLEYLHEV